MPQHIKYIMLKKALNQKRALFFYVKKFWQKVCHFTYRNAITITTGFLSVSLCLLVLYSLVSPLPELHAPSFADEQPMTSNDIQARNTAPLETYTGLLKTRDLFKPSIPIPAEKKIGKTTAQQLAQRLKFLGTSGNEENLSALVFVPERGPGSFQVGDRVAEFVLKSIKKDRLVLDFGDEQITLKR